ncbi:ester cyclase [Amycolatopsis vastitatis]|uniref:SnoaL-like domain-containing protein n=1 Tax=Amycolatopsis vastitatis TaxID=1905142 RepID=A0A229T535_9PSEU|nr:ester cyclase [Amycolatopsis vastitatis]OXM65889.1 hypothetical protein CF165_21120 [Amycolatopsis vastitatis]
MTQSADQSTEATRTDPVIQQTFRTLVSTPAFFALAHFDYGVGASFPPAKGAGPVAFRVVRGTLEFTAEGVVTKTPAGSRTAQDIPAGQTFTVTADDQLVVPGDVVHSARTAGDGPARILGLALFAGEPAQQFPPGITFEPLTLGPVTALPAAPATASVRRFTLAAGRHRTSEDAGGPRILHVESGTLTAKLRSGTGTVTRAADPLGRSDPLTAGQPAELSAGDGVLLQAGGVVEVEGDGATVLDAAVGGRSGRQADNVALVLGYADDVSGDAPGQLAARYFADSYLLHDAVWGEEVGLTGVAGLAKAGSTRFSGWSARIDDQAAQDDLVATRWALTFVHQGKEVGIPGITITRVREGKMAEGWEAPDVNELLRQTGAASAPGELDADGGDDVTATAGRFVYDLWSAGDLTVVDTLFAPDYTNHTPLAGQRPGRDGVRQFVARWRTAFPDVNVSVDLLVVDRGRAVVRWTSRGTHRGGLLGIPPSGRYLTLSGITVLAVRAGAIVESWQQWDIRPLLATGSH